MLLTLPAATGMFVLRQPIYEKDRLDPVDPAAKLDLDKGLLAQFPPRPSTPLIDTPNAETMEQLRAIGN